MDGNVVVSQTHIQIELLGWMEKYVFIHPQMWGERMESDIYIEREREKKKKPHSNLVFMDGKCCVSSIHSN
jgi:hypothetical protein